MNEFQTNDEEFEKIYAKLNDSIKSTNMEDIQKQISDHHLFSTITAIIIAIIFMRFIGLVGGNESDFFILYWRYGLAICCFVLLICMAFLPKKNVVSYDKYVSMYKKNVIENLIGEFGIKYEYNPLDGIEEKEYFEGDFNTEFYWKYESGDLIKIFLENGSKCKLADTKYIPYRKNNSYYMSKDKSYSGMLVTLELDKGIDDTIYIRNKNMYKIKPKNLERVILNSQEFENEFCVYSSNRIAIMRLLTPDIMEYFLEIRKKINCSYEITIKNKKIFIRFFSGSFFEPSSISSQVIDKNILYKDYLILKYSIEFTNKIVDLINKL